MFFVPPTSLSKSLAAFAAAYEARRRNRDDARFDAPTSKALDTVLDAFVAKARAGDRLTEGQADDWMEPFRKRVHFNDNAGIDGWLDLAYHRLADYRWICATVDYVTRSRLYDSHWRQISLPADLRWNDPWRPDPTELKYGYILADEASIRAEGGTVPERLEWLKVSGHAAKLVKRIDAYQCLDYEGVSVLRGTIVRLRVKEEPETFGVTGADPGLSRDLTWRCTPNGIKLVCSEPKDLGVRFIDREIEKALRARHRTAVQRRIVKLWPADHDSDSIEWSEKRFKDGSRRVSFDNGVGFVLGGRPGSYRLLRVGKDRSYKQ